MISIYNHNCTLCDLHSLGAQTICMEASVGSLPAMLIGEAPGATEDEVGKPFVGKAGQELDRALKAAGLSRDQVTVTNAVKCRPPGNRTPGHQEIRICSKAYLIPELDLHTPGWILLLGRTAIELFVRNTVAVSVYRGAWIETDGPRMLATWHPAYVCRQRVHSEIWQQFRNDVAMFAKEVLSG